MTDQFQRQHRDPGATRRCVLLCAGALGAAGVLSACSTAFVPYDANGAGQAPPPAAPAGGAGGGTGSAPGGMGSAVAMPQGTARAKQGGAEKGSVNQASAKQDPARAMTTGTLLGMAADIPVGGGKIFAAAKVVVTQPSKGVFKAFSAVCTHVGCLCNQVANGTIDCPCHGAQFKITDGSVVTGPAPTALAPKAIAVTDGKILLQ